MNVHQLKQIILEVNVFEDFNINNSSDKISKILNPKGDNSKFHMYSINFPLDISQSEALSTIVGKRDYRSTIILLN